MADTVADLVARFTADTASFVQGANQVQNSLRQTSSQAQTAGAAAQKSTVGFTALKTAFQAIVALAVVSFFKSAVQAADAYNLALIKLASSYNVNKNAQTVSLQGFKDLAQSVSDTTMVTRDQALAMETLAISQGRSGTQIQQLIPLAAQLSEKFGIDSRRAMLGLTQAFDGNGNTLRRWGITFTGLVKGVDNSQTVFAQARQKVGDLSAVENTIAFQTNQFGKALDHLKVTIGEGIIPVVRVVLQDALIPFMHILENIPAPVLQMVAVLTGLGLVMKPLGGLVNILGGSFKLVGGVFTNTITLAKSGISQLTGGSNEAAAAASTMGQEVQGAAANVAQGTQALEGFSKEARDIAYETGAVAESTRDLGKANMQTTAAQRTATTASKEAAMANTQLATAQGEASVATQAQAVAESDAAVATNANTAATDANTVATDAENVARADAVVVTDADTVAKDANTAAQDANKASMVGAKGELGTLGRAFQGFAVVGALAGIGIGIFATILGHIKERAAEAAKALGELRAAAIASGSLGSEASRLFLATGTSRLPPGVAGQTNVGALESQLAALQARVANAPAGPGRGPATQAIESLKVYISRLKELTPAIIAANAAQAQNTQLAEAAAASNRGLTSDTELLSAAQKDLVKVVAGVGQQFSKMTGADVSKPVKDLSDAATVATQAYVGLQVAMQAEGANAIEVSDAIAAALSGDTSLIDELGPQTKKAATDLVKSQQDIAATFTKDVADMQSALTNYTQTVAANIDTTKSRLSSLGQQHKVTLDQIYQQEKKAADQIQAYANGVATLRQRFGDSANNFIEWAATQQNGYKLIDAAATGNRKTAEKTFKLFQDNADTAQSVANKISSPLKKAFGIIVNAMTIVAEKMLIATGVSKDTADALLGIAPPAKKAADSTLALSTNLKGLDVPKAFTVLQTDAQRAAAAIDNAAGAVRRLAGELLVLASNPKLSASDRGNLAKAAANMIAHTGGLIMHEGGGVLETAAELPLKPLHLGGTPARVQRFHSGDMKLAPDEVPAILQVGEFVVRREAVRAWGVPVMKALNEAKGPTKQQADLVQKVLKGDQAHQVDAKRMHVGSLVVSDGRLTLMRPGSFPGPLKTGGTGGTVAMRSGDIIVNVNVRGNVMTQQDLTAAILKDLRRLKGRQAGELGL